MQNVQNVNVIVCMLPYNLLVTLKTLRPAVKVTLCFLENMTFDYYILLFPVVGATPKHDTGNTKVFAFSWPQMMWHLSYLQEAVVPQRL